MASDIKTAVARFAAATSNGLQELTIGGLGWTPKAALFFTVGGIADGTIRDNAYFSIGAIGPDGGGGSNEWTLSSLSEDGVSSGNNDNSFRDDACLGPSYYASGSVVEARATGDGDGGVGNPGPIANGWRVNWTTAPDQAYHIIAVFFGGADFTAHCGTFLASGVLDGATTVSDPGFRPTAACFVSTFNAGALPQSVSQLRFAFGWAHDGAGSPQPQSGLSLRSSGGATSSLFSTIAPASVGAELGTAGAFYRQEIAFTETGFTATQRDSDGGGNQDVWAYLALDLGDRAFWVDIVDAPTSTGSDWTVSGPGFTPQAGGLVLSNHTAVSTFESSGIAVECFGVGVFDGDNAYCAAFSGEDGLGTTNTASLSDDVTARPLDGSQADVHLLSGAPSFNASGWTVPSAQITTADATARKWIAWAIETAAAETVTGTLSLDSAVQKQSALAGSLTAALQARKAATVQGDAALRALTTLAGELDAALRWALAAQAGLDGALAIEANETAAADAALRRAFSAGADLGGALQAGRSEGAAIDALLTGLSGSTVALDAALAALRSGGLTLDAALTLLRGRDSGLDAALRRLRTAAGSLDAALTASGVVNASLRAALSKALALTAALSVVVRQADLVLKSDLDGALRTTQALSLSLQGVLRKAAQLSGGLNGALQRSAEPLTGSLQAALTRTAALVATLSGAVELMRSLAVGLNAALQERAALAALLDAVVGAPQAAYAPRGTRGQAVEGRDRAIVGPDNRIILVPANPRRH